MLERTTYKIFPPIRNTTPAQVRDHVFLRTAQDSDVISCVAYEARMEDVWVTPIKQENMLTPAFLLR